MALRMAIGHVLGRQVCAQNQRDRAGGDDIACAVRQAVFTQGAVGGQGVIAYAVLQCMPQPALLHQQHGQSQNDISAETLHTLRCTVHMAGTLPRRCFRILNVDFPQAQ